MEMSMQQYIFANGYRVFGGTTEEWAAHDDPLYYRELGIEYTDDGRVLMKAGIRTEDDSPTPWSKLPYIYGKQGDKGDIGPEGPSPDFEWDGTKIRFKKPDVGRMGRPEGTERRSGGSPRDCRECVSHSG